MNSVAEHAEALAGREDRFAAELLSELPEPLQVGGGTVLWVAGRCDGLVDRRSLRIELAGRTAPAAAEPVPGDRPAWHWWALIDLPRGCEPGWHELRLRALSGGREVEAPLGPVQLVEIDLSAAPPAPSRTGSGPLIAVCMATHEPDPDRLALQLDSIRGQDWPQWVCVISDDASSPERFAAIEELTTGDERFVVSRSEARLGFYRNFERALRLTPVEADLVALADQDDEWDPDKLSALQATLEGSPDALLAYSDMRIVDAEGRPLSDTYWILRPNRWDDIASLLVANTVTGAASIMRASLLADALPFPATIGEPYHDHWLALCALAGGELAYLDRPTYTRVRHLESVTAGTRHAEALRAIGEGAADPVRASGRGLRRRLAARPGGEATYFDRYLLLAQLARVLELRFGERIAPAKRRALRRLVDAERSWPATAWLAWRALRSSFGPSSTMGRERVLLGAVLWRRLARLRRAQAS